MRNRTTDNKTILILATHGRAEESPGNGSHQSQHFVHVKMFQHLDSHDYATTSALVSKYNIYAGSASSHADELADSCTECVTTLQKELQSNAKISSVSSRSFTRVHTRKSIHAATSDEGLPRRDDHQEAQQWT